MAGAVSLTSSDTLQLFGRLITDLADGDCAKLTFENELAAVKTGKNGNSLFAYNETGNQAMLELRVVRGSADDKFLLQKLAAMKRDFSGFVAASGEFTKRVGDGLGAITNDVYSMNTGVFTKNPEVVTNAEGSTDQSVSIWTLKFANAPRTLT